MTTTARPPATRRTRGPKDPLRVARRWYTVGERAYLARRRRKVPAAEWARLHGMPVKTYRAMELGRIPVTAVVPLVGAAEVTALEAAHLLRRRSGLSLREVASGVGVSHVTLLAMESGAADPARLYRYWVYRIGSLIGEGR